MAFIKYDINITVELDGVDITKYLVPRPNISISKGRDYPNFGVFNASGVDLPLLNISGIFDPGRNPNFFTERGRSADGYGTRLLMIITRNTSEQLHITGEVAEVQQSLNTSLVALIVRDVSLRLRRSKFENFGQQISRRITDYPEVYADYEVSQYHFRFPEGLTPVLRGSVSANIVVNDVSQSVEIVEQFTPSGTFSYRRATIDYENNVLQLEAMPPDGNSSIIDATWKIDYRYKRPDFMVREIMNDFLYQTLPDYAISPVILEKATKSFNTHGRPFVQESGVVRHLQRNPADKSIWMAYQNSLLRYDETNDTYTKIATTPDDATITETPPLGYGTEQADARIRVGAQTTPRTAAGGSISWTTFDHLSIVGDTVYLLEKGSIPYRSVVYNYNFITYDITAFSTDSIAVRGESKYLSSNIFENSYGESTHDPLASPADAGYARRRIETYDFSVYNNEIYVLEDYRNPPPANYNSGGRRQSSYPNNYRIQKYTFDQLDATETTANRNVDVGVTYPGIQGDFLVVTADNFIVANGSTISFYRYPQTGTYTATTTWQNLDGTTPVNIDGLAITNQYIYLLSNTDRTIRAYLHNGTHQPLLDITTTQEYKDIAIEGNTLYALRSGVLFAPDSRGNLTFPNRVENAYIDSFNLVNASNYHGFSIFQFDTIDFNTFYCLATNTARGDITQDTNFNSNRVLRYVRSTNTWTTLLDQTGGYPQIAEQFDFISQGQILADNRKNFQIIRYNSIDYIFFRRVKGTTSELAFFNTSNSLIGTVQSFSTTATTNQGREWSTDFIMETRSDNSIWSYFFMVNYNVQSGVFNGGHLQIIARRVFPSFFASSRFHVETFASTLTTYPISVSGVALSNDKLYFVLDYISESTTVAGKAELCVIPKGGGTRTVLKTYNNPLLGPRSPAVIGTSVYYLEGGSVRSTGATEADRDLNYYPNEGGKLIEIQNDNTIVDHGIIWRSGNVLDSPNPEAADRRYDGWGLHNAVTSNMMVGDNDTLHFIAGYGYPFRTAENLPTTNPIILDGNLENYNWLQYGTPLPMKIPHIKLGNTDYWSACTNMAVLANAEIGFSPKQNVVTPYLTANPTANAWETWSTLFFRDRRVRTGQLSMALTSSTVLTSLVINDTDLQTFSSTGGKIIIDNEIISYTSAVISGDNITLSGTTRATDDSDAAVHAINTPVYFIEKIIRDDDISLLEISAKRTDLVNVYNTIELTYNGGVYRKSDQDSIAKFGETVLSQNVNSLNNFTIDWIELLADEYLERFKDLRNLIEIRIPFTPVLELGEVVVLYTTRGFVSNFVPYEVMRFTHNLRSSETYSTAITIRQI